MSVVQSPTVDFDGAATQAVAELVAKAQAQLALFDLPHTGPDGARAAACAMAGVTFVSVLAQWAAREQAMPHGLAQVVEALCARAADTFAAIVTREMP